MTQLSSFQRQGVFFIIWSIVMSVLIGLIYVSVQQDLRQTANDSQIQLAEDSAARLSQGDDVGNVVPSTMVSLEKSLAPFVMVFDSNGKLLASSGQLNGQNPDLPIGVLDAARSHSSHQNRLTWEPQTGVRMAAVVQYYSGKTAGYVVAGRSLREVEKREDRLTIMVVLTWVGLILLGGAVTFLLRRPRAPRQ